MPEETTRIAVETSGSVSLIWQWIIGAIAAAVAGVWGHLTGRISKLEESAVTEDWCKSHITDERDKFSVLFRKSEEHSTKLSKVAEAVARIEGKLDREKGD